MKAKEHHGRAARTATRWENMPAQHKMSPVAKSVLVAAGLLLMGLAGFVTYTGDYIFAAHWTVFIRFPGMLEGQYYFFPIWWVTIGLPLLLFGLGWFFPAFRNAVRAPWRQPKFAVPLVTVLILFAFTMQPWEYASTPAWDTGSKMVFYLTLAGTGFILFLTGFYEKLRFLDQPLARAYQWLMALDRRTFMLLIFGFTFLVANLISLFVFEHMPHIQDSISQLFQARIFATGRLHLTTPCFPDFFDYTHIINNGYWYSQYLFLHSLFLLIGVFAGIPWIINPLLGALTIPAIYALGRKLYGERTGRLAGILACLTPFIFDMSSEYMNHSGALLFTTLFILFYFRTLDLGRWYDPLVAGLALGLVANIRPYTALAIGGPFAIYGLYRAVKEPRRLIPKFGLMVILMAAVTSFIFVYNWLTNGNPLLFGYVVKWGPGHEIGFGKSGWGAEHTPFRGLINTGNDMNLMNKFLYEWPIPSLLPIAVLFAARTKNHKDWLLLASSVSLSAAYFFYWFHNVCFGPRFLYESSACLILLTVRGGQELGTFLRRTCQMKISDKSAATFIRRVWLIMTIIMLGVGLPPLFRTYHMYGNVDGTLVRTVRQAGLKNSLVFCHHFGNGFSANTLNLDGDVVYAKDYGILNAALTIAYPDRHYYYANKDTLRPLANIDYPHSQLKRALDEMTEFLSDTLTHSYNTIIWPFKDIPIQEFDSSGPRIIDFRDISAEIFTNRHTPDDYLPAIACWILNDEREHLRLFSFMNDLQNVIAGDYKFTLLSVTSEGTGAVYDISTVSGNEVTVPNQPGPMPIR